MTTWSMPLLVDLIRGRYIKLECFANRQANVGEAKPTNSKLQYLASEANWGP